VVSCIVLLAFGLRAYRLHGLGDFDFDEVASVWYAGLPLVEAVQRLSGAIFEHPPLYYVVLRAWMASAGTSAAAGQLPFSVGPPAASEDTARWLSVVLGTLAIPATYSLARRVAGPHAALVAACFIAVSPLEVFYSREARMYALVTVLVLLAGYWFVRAVEQGAWRHWLAYAALALAALYSHYLSAFTLLALNLWFVLTQRSAGWAGRSARPGGALPVGMMAEPPVGRGIPAAMPPASDRFLRVVTTLTH
jgi:uncharacterized membrane protein